MKRFMRLLLRYWLMPGEFKLLTCSLCGEDAQRRVLYTCEECHDVVCDLHKSHHRSECK